MFQDNAEFVTSRWTESTNDSGANIYRNSKVGIGNKPAPVYNLDVVGSLGITTGLYFNGERQYADDYGVIKQNRKTLAGTTTIQANFSASSNGPITINSGATVTVSAGADWTIS